MHHRDFGSSSILKDHKVKQIAVLGGGKSAADIAYAAATAGKTISSMIRLKGSGPGALLPAKEWDRIKTTMSCFIHGWLQPRAHRCGLRRRG
jgi:cation diffusion facilitator CzcD-associated flavoprotein CzcO